MNADVLGVCLRPETPWWVTYERAAETGFVQRDCELLLVIAYEAEW